MAVIARPGDTIVLALDKYLTLDEFQALVEALPDLRVLGVTGLRENFIYRSDET